MERDAQKDERLQYSNIRVKSVECEQKLKIRVVHIHTKKYSWPALAVYSSSNFENLLKHC